MPEPLALYVHVPFCGQRCAYCHFAIKVLHPRSNPHTHHSRYLNALNRELAGLADQHQKRPLTSIFLGGGTPSHLGPGLLGQLLKHVHQHFDLDGDCEITLEVNPEDIQRGDLQALAQAGFNRLSVGVQSFHNPSLTAIGRPHDSATAQNVLREALAHFPKGVSLDLILGLPHQNSETLTNDLAQVKHLGLQHVSIYMLERDLPTPLDKMAPGLPMPDEDDQADFYETVCSTLAEAGFAHYEISNFALPGFASRHNQVYWRCGDYLAAGPAAVGRVGHTLTANHEQLTPWLRAVEAKGSGMDYQEQWSEVRLQQERLVQGMRLQEGVLRHWLKPQHWERLKPAQEAGLLEEVDNRLRLTSKGRLLGNEVFAVFVEDNQ